MISGQSKFRATVENILGAFGDAAILFPLIAVLTQKSGFSGTMLFATSAVAYVVAGFLFRIPMSVQPLKSIAIAGVALGASFNEVRMSAALLGVVCLLCIVLKADRFADRVPRPIIQSVQFGLGCLLILQGGAMIDPQGGATYYLINVALITLMYFGPRFIAFPFLGLLATGSVIWGLIFPEAHAPSAVALTDAFRWSMVAAIILPQIALTFSNSVLGTHDVAKHYFGERAKHVTVRNLLASIGIGNILTGWLGGLPFCHGSGGLTAHVRGGARFWWMNLVIAGVLGALALAQAHTGTGMVTLPKSMMLALLITTGVFHLELAKPLFRERGMWGPARLVATAIAVYLTRNLLWALFSAVVIQILEAQQKRMKVAGA